MSAPLSANFGAAGAWARRLLTRPGKVWAELALRAPFVERVFPDGLVFENGAISNPGNCLLALPSGDESADGGEMVGPTGFEPVLSP